MTDLPPNLTAFAQLLDAQPEPVRAAFHYCLALMMVEAGEAGRGRGGEGVAPSNSHDFQMTARDG